MPSHDTLGDGVALLDPALFKACFTSWGSGLRARAPDLAGAEVIAIDGKTSRRSHAGAQGREPLHRLSTWASGQRLVLGQAAAADTSNEITASPLLLEHLELAGALVTIDAMGTQVALAETICTRGGDYVLALKANRPLPFAEVAAFADPSRPVQTHQTTDGEHGRIEVRCHRVCDAVDWLFADRRYPGEPDVPHLAMVESQTERDGRVQHERRYDLGSAKLAAETFARAVRAHWGVENTLHWMLDVVLRDDLARRRTGHGPENMAVVRHMALNLLQQAKPDTSLKNRRKLAACTLDHLAKLIRGSA